MANGGRCSPEQVATLKKRYGSLDLLRPYLDGSFWHVKDLSCLQQESKTGQQYALKIAKEVEARPVQSDSFYIQALCASHGAAEVVALLPPEHKERLCGLAFAKKPVLLGLLPINERSPERCEAACIGEEQALAHVPDTVQTEAFLWRICAKNPKCFRYIADPKKTESLALLVCQQDNHLFPEVPLRLRSEKLCRVVYRWYVKKMPEAVFTEPFCLWLVKKNPLALRDIPADKRTVQMYEYACPKVPELLSLVPEEMKTASFCQKVIQSPNGFCAYPYLPLHFVWQEEGKLREQCKKLCEQDGYNLTYVPDILKNEELYRIASKQFDWRLSTINPRDRSRALCLKNGAGRLCDFDSVPDDRIDLEFLFSVLGGKGDLALHTRLQKLFTEEHYTTFVCVAALHWAHTQLKLLTWPELPERFRTRLIDFLAGLGDPLSGLPKLPLINRHNPLRPQLNNPMVWKLLWQAHTAQHYEPACQTDGQVWLRYLKEQLPKYLNSPLPLIDETLSAPLKTGHIKAKGGRTLQVQVGDTIYYYKFQRKNEPLADLVREGLIHQFRAENAQGAWAKLASDLPQDPHFFALPKTMWPQQTHRFTDVVEEQKEGECEWANVYRYTASADYGRYAHQRGSAAECPFTKPEKAILTACYDMGLFASMGLMLTSLLPAMHSAGGGRSWQTLYDLFGYNNGMEMFPGTLRDWNGKATEQCDIGFNGLRDVGDYEQFGAIRSCFEKCSNDGSVQPVQTGQRLAVASTLCDNVMAAILVRSRLRQDDGNYHYKKEQALAETACFIGSVCDHLLTGLAGKGKGQLQPGITRKAETFKTHNYDQWLHRAALEIVYWTARQPDLNSGKIPALQTVSYDPMDSWSSHLRTGRNLSSALYDAAEFQPSLALSDYPASFRNFDGTDNLGAESSVFPFITLVQGLTSLAGDILAGSQRHSPPENGDTAMPSD